MKYKIYSLGILTQQICNRKDDGSVKAAFNQLNRHNRIIQHLEELNNHLIENCFKDFSIESIQPDKKL